MEKLCSIIIRNLPASVGRELRSATALEGKPMNLVIMELIIRYLEEGNDYGCLLLPFADRG